MWEHEKHADDMQMRQTDELQQSHKSIAQINCTRWDYVMIKNGQSQTMLLHVPEQLRCLWRHLRQLI